MHKLLNFFSFPLLLTGIIFLSNGVIGINSFHLGFQLDTKTSDQINNLYSEKEITLKGPPVSEILSKKINIKIKKKPLSPNIISNIEKSWASTMALS